MAASKREQIAAAFAARLATVTAANGYETDVKQVYSDDIPMGMDLQDHQLPAILVIDKADDLGTKLSQLQGMWELKLQLWNTRVTDGIMQRFVRDVFKAVFADSAVATVIGSFRSIHTSIVEVIPNAIAGDLNMIEENRVYEISFIVHYRTELYNL